MYVVLIWPKCSNSSKEWTWILKCYLLRLILSFSLLAKSCSLKKLKSLFRTLIWMYDAIGNIYFTDVCFKADELQYNENMTLTLTGS